VPQSSFEKIANGHGRQTVLFLPRLESKNILFPDLYLCGVLYQNDALMVENEIGQYVGECGPATKGVQGT
jgi:hypothetical protein